MRLVQIIGFLFLSVVGHAQVVSSLSVSNDTISIGEEIEVYYKLTAPKTAKLSALIFSPLDSLDSLIPTNSQDTSSIPYYAEVEWDASFMNYKNKALPYHLTRKTDLGNAYEYKDTFTATFWDLGFFELFHPRMAFDTSALRPKVMNLETPTVFVTAPLDIKNPDTTSVILPIKDIIVSEKTWKDYIKSGLYILTALLIAALLFFFFRKKKPEETTVVVAKPKEPAHVIALSKLDLLAKDEAWKKGKVKEYQTDLTYTIREYLENRYEINALESTTDEITQTLKQHNFSQEHESDLKEILQIADLVKFAKAKPTEDLNESFLVKAKEFVIDTKRIITQQETDSTDG